MEWQVLVFFMEFFWLWHKKLNRNMHIETLQICVNREIYLIVVILNFFLKKWFTIWLLKGLYVEHDRRKVFFLFRYPSCTVNTNKLFNCWLLTNTLTHELKHWLQSPRVNKNQFQVLSNEYEQPEFAPLPWVFSQENGCDVWRSILPILSIYFILLLDSMGIVSCDPRAFIVLVSSDTF